MFDLLDDGSIAIDFTEIADDGTETVTKVTVKAPPTFGAYKRLRAELETINRDRDAFSKQMRDDESIGGSEFTARLNAHTEDGAVRWWKFVINGDDSYAGRGDKPAPDDVDTWPTYMIGNDALQQALAHWKTVPLARGGQLVPR